MGEAVATPASGALEGLQAEKIVFYDGVCGFCHGTVRWLIERDPEARLHFAPLQGSTAERCRRAFGSAFPPALETLVYVDAGASPARIERRARAVQTILELLGQRGPLLTALRTLPRPLCELGYRLFARFRYRLFGRLESCSLPSPELRERFLD